MLAMKGHKVVVGKVVHSNFLGASSFIVVDMDVASNGSLWVAAS